MNVVELVELAHHLSGAALPVPVEVKPDASCLRVANFSLQTIVGSYLVDNVGNGHVDKLLHAVGFLWLAFDGVAYSRSGLCCGLSLGGSHDDFLLGSLLAVSHYRDGGKSQSRDEYESGEYGSQLSPESNVSSLGQVSFLEALQCFFRFFFVRSVVVECGRRVAHQLVVFLAVFIGMLM